MLKWSIGLRLLALVRRGVRALERIAAATETEARIADERWTHEHGPRPKPKPLDIGQFDPRGADAEWRKLRMERGEPVPDDDEDLAWPS